MTARSDACREFVAQNPDAEWGPAHIVLSDLNVTAPDITYALKALERYRDEDYSKRQTPELLAATRTFLTALATMPEDETRLFRPERALPSSEGMTTPYGEPVYRVTLAINKSRDGQGWYWYTVGSPTIVGISDDYHLIFRQEWADSVKPLIEAMRDGDTLDVLGIADSKKHLLLVAPNREPND